jgi:hypothetical protein
MPLQAVEQRDGGIVPVEPKACPSAGSARALAARLAQTHVGVIAWARTGNPELGDWDSARTGIIPDGGSRGSAISPCPSARVAVRAKRQAAPPKCSALPMRVLFAQGRQKERETVDSQSPLQCRGLDASAKVRRLLESPQI